MAKVPRTRLGALPPNERDEIEEILAEAKRLKQRYGTSRFVSDEGDAMAFPLLAWIAALVGIAAMYVNWTPRELVEMLVFIPVALPGSLLHGKIGLAFLLAVVVFLWVPVHFLRVHGRHGWMLTSFGFVTIRGKKIRLARWNDIASATRRRIRTKTNSFSVVTLTTNDGKVLESYAGALFDALKTKLPAGAKIADNS